jgi:hypothetical protein
VDDNSIFYHVGAESDQLEYVKNLYISRSSESGVMAGGKFKNKAVISADFSSSGNKSGKIH